jgi:chemotaxis protein MotB
VLHYFEEQQVHPRRLSAVAYGEYHPVAPNTTPEGRSQNRRVEVVILPNQIQKVKN